MTWGTTDMVLANMPKPIGLGMVGPSPPNRPRSNPNRA
ncbi:uncharacterized protein G2W53_001313 [Senna tora]|uniref:Uncharacterized protein n=1 Tax=Senna tora TaxID=362788 RepID=A0A834XJG2_9FABA|nr:uncharacterized protein G2W53_001313 [Senna tora]